MTILWTQNIQLQKMTPKTLKKPLDLNHYDQYGISQNYSAFEIIISDVELEECDNLEAQYLGQGYKIFSSEMMRIQGEIYDLKLIVAKMSYTF